MKYLNLTDIDYNITNCLFDHFIRVDHLFISSKVENLKQIDFLKSLGIKNVIDLKTSNETSFNDKDEFECRDFNYYNLPISNLADLDFEKLQKFDHLTNSNHGKTLVYCMSGNRVAALIALNTSLVCGHPKKRSLHFAEKIGMKNQKTKGIVSEILEVGRLK